LTPNPILRVLSTFQKHRVKCLLIGGQACIIYGAAEFSRDSDFVIHVSAENLRRLRKALAELCAETIFFPRLTARSLRRGHACHFRCHREDVKGLRIDIMAKMRGCDDFERLWRRRTELEGPEGVRIAVIGLRDLVQCKKTQRDKDWLMLRRLVQNDIYLNRESPQRGQARWWLSQCRNAETLISLSDQFRKQALAVAKRRPLVEFAIAGNTEALAAALAREEEGERQRDREYWQPLREELERMRLGRSRR